MAKVISRMLDLDVFVIMEINVYIFIFIGHCSYGAASRVNTYNGLRQAHVNNIAEHVGAGIGTADVYGVPGTPVRKAGYGHGDAGYGVNNIHGHSAGYNTYGGSPYGVVHSGAYKG